MKLIIDIPDEDYNMTLKTGFLTTYLAKCPLSLIKHGIPLDDLRADLHATAEMHSDYHYYLRDEWIDEYFDNVGKESEK